MRALVINEVAWAGTRYDPSDEWIELYNPGSTAIDLSAGWFLFNAGNTLDNTPTGDTRIMLGQDPANHFIPAHGYYLLERNDFSNISDIPGDQTYTGALGDSGDILFLDDPTGHQIDSANSNDSVWPAGSASTFCTMQRYTFSGAETDLSWRTNNNYNKNGHDAGGNAICGSPKAANIFSLTPTPQRSPTKTRTPVPGTFIPSQIIINEFLPHPHSDWNLDDKVDINDSFIEVKNVSTIAVSIGGYRLDDGDGDSPPFAIPSMTLEAGARAVFFTGQTHIFLSNLGDSVRLFKPSGAISDAFTYGVAEQPDVSWCRLPDGYNNAWNNDCQPTPQETNRALQSGFADDQLQAKLCLSKTILPGLYQAECTSSGLEIWSPFYWAGDLQMDYPLYIERNKVFYIIE